ncbi:MAG: hypothetical protein NTW78_07730 [Campylobacterales bacterium]|nr:hypothetical protein [Campylobacterales bacterium]
MGELHLSYATPHYDKVYFNFEDEVSELISNLNTKKNQIYNIYPKDYDVAQKIVTHSLKILPKIKNLDIYTFWFNFNNNDYISFAQQLKIFLIKIWRNNLFNYSQIEENILSMLLLEDNIQKFSKLNFSALFSKLYNKQFIIVIDISHKELDSFQKNKIEEIFHLIECIKDLKETLCIDTIILNNYSKYDAKNIQLDINNQTIKPYLEMLNSVNTYQQIDSINIVSSNNFNKLIHIINPIVMLNQTVSHEIINYIASTESNIENEITNLLKNNLIQHNFNRDGYNLTKDSMKTFKKNNVNEMDIITANGSKILSFQSPYQLLDNDFSLQTLKKAHRENFMLIDVFSSLFTSKTKQNHLEKELYDISLSLSNEVINILNVNNEYHTKILLTYFSQLFLKDYKLEYKYFKLLENLTYGLSNFIENVYKYDNNKKYNISRWITNLGYIYDEMKYTTNDREKIYYNAAQRIGKISDFTNEVIELKTKYTLGWQLKDSNQMQKAVDTFLETAKRFFYMFKNNIFGKPVYLVHEMYWLGYIISKKENIESSFLDDKILENILLEHPLFYHSADVDMFLHEKYKHINFYPNSTYNIFFCDYDLYTAIVVSYRILQKKLNVKLILVNKKEDIKLGKNNIILGAPDSPNGIGDFLKQNDKDLTALYQIRLFENFFEISENDNFMVLMGCGLGSMIDGLNQLLEKIDEGKNDMDFGIFLPLMQQAGNKLWEVTLDRIGDIVKDKLKGSTVKEENVEKEISNLKNTSNIDRKQEIEILLNIDNPMIQKAFRETILSNDVILNIFKNVSQTELRTFDEIENFNQISLSLIDFTRKHANASIEDKNDLAKIRENLLNIQSKLNNIKRNRHAFDYSELNKINIEQADIVNNAIEDYTHLMSFL